MLWLIFLFTFLLLHYKWYFVLGCDLLFVQVPGGHCTEVCTNAVVGISWPLLLGRLVSKLHGQLALPNVNLCHAYA